VYTFEYILRRASLLFPDQEVVDDYGRKTYRELYDNVLRLIPSLQSKGIRKGDVVAIMGLNNVKYVELVYALTSMGAIVYPVNLRLPPDQVLYTLVKSHSKFLIYEDQLREYARLAEGRLEGLKSMSFSEVSYSGERGRPVSGEDDAVVMLFTSGTTGLPKAVLHVQRKTVMGAMFIADQLAYYNTPAKLGQGDVMLPLVPLYHIFAWGSLLIAPMVGAKLIYMEKFDPRAAIEKIEREGVTWISGVPTILHMLLEAGLNKRGLKALISGSPIPDGLAKRMMERGIRFTVGYGSTEVLVASMTIETYLVRSGSVELHKVTHPVLGAEIKIDVKDPKDKVGEILVRAPWLPDGYYEDEEKTRESFTPDGWFRTGDIGYMTEDGGLVILDRVKDVIKSGGEWISSSILEAAISELPWVSIVAVIGVKNEKWGERPIAVIKPSRPISPQEAKQEVIGHLMELVRQGKLSKFWVPDDVIIVSDMPLTSTGKVDKKALRGIVTGSQ
jgi:acyl-CoA synthetase (AMP-forming)/AMP-acid ligase II